VLCPYPRRLPSIHVLNQQRDNYKNKDMNLVAKFKALRFDTLYTCDVCVFS